MGARPGRKVRTSDAGIIYTPGQLCVEHYAHHPVQLVFDDTNQLFMSLSRRYTTTKHPPVSTAQPGPFVGAAVARHVFLIEYNAP
jgi:hypothetical protein